MYTAPEYEQCACQFRRILSATIANVVYGVGVDGLYNFFERGAYTQGVFLGLILAGSTWNGGVP
ncbi:outer membrane beta-barrel protein [Helicobacter felis]|uniref:outer membrane beta-barrel protein n=1 Tax=Helicobacter felis TaxID=214 RepID=UPI0009D77CDB|nr:outer membrane beta-barrel protein [Helicobacter felis]